jgi:6-phosphogluconolactonase (cycloisomerase 2 family)
MQNTNKPMKRDKGRWHRRFRIVLTALMFGFLFPSTDEAATTGELMQRPGLEGCISDDGTGGTCIDGNSLLGVGWLAVSPDGNYAYLVALNSSAVATFARDTSTGTLTQLDGVAGCVSEVGDGVTCEVGRALANALSVALSPDGKHLYVASRNSNAVAVFSRNVNTGQLTQLSGAAGCIAETGDGVTCTDGKAIVGPRVVTVSPDGKNIYIGSRDGDAVAVFSRNRNSGALTQLSGTAGCVSETGTGGLCIDGKGLLGARGVAVSPDNRHVYVASQDNNTVAVFFRDTNTGALTQLSGSAGCIAENGDGITCADGRGLVTPVHLEVSPDGRQVYVASRDSNGLAIFSRNANTGALTQLSGSAGCIAENGDGITCADGTGLREPVFLTLSPDGSNVYVTSQASHAVAEFSRNVMTGELTQLSGLAACISEDGTAMTCADGNGLMGAIAVTLSPDGQNVYVASFISNAVTVFSRDNPAVPTQLQFADVNGDGRADYLNFDSVGDAVLRVALSNFGDFTPPEIWLQHGESSPNQVQYADVNGDGKTDALYFDTFRSNGVWVSLSTGSGFTIPQMWLQHGESTPNQIQYADVNGDGKADALYFDTLRSGGVWVSLSTGNSFTVPQMWLHHGESMPNQIQYVDVSGDGKADALYFDTLRSGGVWVSLSTGSGFTIPQMWLQHGESTPNQIQYADVNGDGKADALYFDTLRSGDVWVSFSSGSSFTAPSPVPAN